MRWLPTSLSSQKPLGEQFRKEVHIRNLPSLYKKVKPEVTRDLLDSESNTLTLLFSSEQNDV